MQKLGVRLKERLNRSAFLFGALAFHLVLFLMIVGYVIFPSAPSEKETGFTETPAAPQVAAIPPHAPQVDAVQPPGQAGKSVVPINAAGGDFPTVQFAKNDLFNEGALNPGNHAGADVRLPVPPRDDAPPRPRVDLPRIRDIAKGREVNGSSNFLKFPIYLAKYANGDWDCNNYTHQGRLDSGALPNLMSKIHEWSNGELDGRQVKVVALDSPDILSNPPPFIFFTGHRDFHLTKAEVANLQQYLLVGGAIWGDSAFAGDGSRFDVAFHREMKRVLPDADLQFQPIPANHAIFTPETKFLIDHVPPGMNQRADPIECINLDGKIAVLYTPNDYSDLMTMVLQPGRNESEAQADNRNYWTADHPLFTPASFRWNATAYYRNYEPSSVMASDKLAMNILVYLLHRYDDELMLPPP